MFQGLKELRSAPSRTALITLTVAMITVMVTFLASLAAGLKYQSVSALQERLSDDQVLILEDSGTASLSSSRLSESQIDTLREDYGASLLVVVRERVDSTPVSVFSSPDIPHGVAQVPSEFEDDALAQASGTPGTITLGGSDFQVERPDRDLYFDHQPVIFVSDADARSLRTNSLAAVVDAEAIDPAVGAPEGTVALSGDDRWNASASYTGEQLSLNLMINLLYVISALVLGAFFMVWTIQRLRGVAISSALGASRRVLIADSMGQAVVVLAVGILGGLAVTGVVGIALAGTLPIDLTAGTMLQPAGILLLAGLAGSALSLRPVLKVSPHEAMAAA